MIQLEYIAKLRVFKADEGWKFAVGFIGITHDGKSVAVPTEVIGRLTFRSEADATAAGLRTLSKVITIQQRAVR